MFFAQGEREIDDTQQGKYERLYRSDEEVEELDEKRQDDGRDRKVEGAYRNRAKNDRRSDEEENLADEYIEEQACC